MTWAQVLWGALAFALVYWAGYRAGRERVQWQVAEMLVRGILRWGPGAVPRNEPPAPLRERNP